MSPTKHLFRIATLVVPSALAWCIAFYDPHPSDLTEAVTYALAPLWSLLAIGLFFRYLSARRGASEAILPQLDVLTATGSALGWLSASAIVLAVWVGWASLAAVGLLGSALFHIVVLLAFVALRGSDPVRGATITRSFTPAVVTEGDDVVEELRFEGTRIPVGYRLFVEGRIGPRWATSRHVLDAGETGEVAAESEIGPAVRGEHDPEPLAVWLEDTFGICRSVRVLVPGDRLTVLPRVPEVAELARTLGRGEGPRAPRATPRLPTEGLFHLREYQQGDDVRRIHWMRSAASRELIVRLPDELPPDRPHVRLVLDTFFPEAFALTCDAPSEQLDAMVSVWLSVGRALAKVGTRVTLVATVPQAGTLVKTRQELTLRTLESARRLGAQVSWQNRMVVDELITDDNTLVVSRAMLARPQQGSVRWIAVVPGERTTNPVWPAPSEALHRFPMGSPDNRWTRRRHERHRIARLRGEHARAIAVIHGVARALPGSYLAHPGDGGTIRLDAFR